ncbi:thioesterase family protein [Mycolicibacterium fallax]|uniref:Thioesterase n=1 Tax=Mycolicibacterium fallax TaxID=1793 RepID=A0A1X1R4S3_MYCFA|nr:thioesterase family protein [Mycolicibacterium fallax]ORU99352.1 thioesterase [Mycolicibacterium fallax]BBY97722.1 thioesterase [Mycolicibacterium fallax]HOW93858.1 thioesterase family protein [Mycolicibacterium fallax]HSA39744.1 thioesterase family protein [Mycobacterium sp.]
MTDCYYHRLDAAADGAVFASTDLTRSNWGPQIQHGSPPMALLTKAIEDQLAGSGLRIGRLSLDILGAVPVTEILVRTSTPRPGRRIALVAAEMAPVADPDRPVARVTGWALAPSDTVEAATDRHPALTQGDARPAPDYWWTDPGYLSSVQCRWDDEQAGARVAWMRSTVGLVDDEPTTALQRLTMVVDSANGIGAALRPDRHMFMNTDTVVHLHRLPAGDEFAMRARASIGPDGIGVTTAELFDHDGFIGTSAQTLLVQAR